MLVPKNEKGGAACIFKICCCGGQVFGKYRFDVKCQKVLTFFFQKWVRKSKTILRQDDPSFPLDLLDF